MARLTDTIRAYHLEIGWTVTGGKIVSICRQYDEPGYEDKEVFPRHSSFNTVICTLDNGKEYRALPMNTVPVKRC